MLQLIPIPAISEGIFWMLFSMNVVFLLISYIPMFPAFLKMRKVDRTVNACSRSPSRASSCT